MNSCLIVPHTRISTHLFCKWSTGVNGVVKNVDRLEILRVYIADATVGATVALDKKNKPVPNRRDVGTSEQLANERASNAHINRARISDSLFVGRSENGLASGNCRKTRPGLYTCRAGDSGWCFHLDNIVNTALLPMNFDGLDGEGPKKPWNMRGGRTVYGTGEVDGVTFANYGSLPCDRDDGMPHRDMVFSNAQLDCDAQSPTIFRNIEQHNVEPASLVYLRPGNLENCVNLDCDGKRHLFLMDDDGSFIGNPGTVLPRAEAFSHETFYGVPYRDGINEPVREDGSPEPWWYINVPNIMRVDRDGYPVDLSQTYIKEGYGIHRPGCTLQSDWNAYRCFTETKYRVLVIENLDQDHLIRRIAPMAISSAAGYTDILAGGGEFGWCMGYPVFACVCVSASLCVCVYMHMKTHVHLLTNIQKFSTHNHPKQCHFMLQAFFPVVAMGQEYTIHFTGTNAQHFRVQLPAQRPDEHAPKDGDKVIVKIYYQQSQRLQVFVGQERRDRRNRILSRARFMESMNMHNGKYKSQLVRDGQWMQGTSEDKYLRQEVSQECACQVEGKGCVQYSLYCAGSTTSNEHGANTYNRETGMLELVVGNHEPEHFIDIFSMPVVQMSMSFAVTIENFYEVKDAFISGIAFVLGIDLNRIHIVDVVPGNARRRRLLNDVRGTRRRRIFQSNRGKRRLLEGTGVNVDFEVLPEAEISVTDCFAQEDGGYANVTVIRSVNLETRVAASLSSSEMEGLTASAGVHFSATSVSVTFEPYQSMTTVEIPVMSSPGYSATSLTFAVILSDPNNCTISDSSATVHILNVHSPPPSPPTLSSTISSAFFIATEWDIPEWPEAPSDDVSEVLEFEVQKAPVETTDDGEESWMSAMSFGAETTSHVFDQLEPYSTWKFRVRARTSKGWGDWSGSSAVYRTLSLCGDGKRHGSEQCDTGSDVDPGCVDCAIVPGYSCSGNVNGTGDVCNSGCPDGIRTAGEECDDANSIEGDGCYMCRNEPGWTCSINPIGATTQNCATVCGDGIKAGTEECDAGSQNGQGQGCDGSCAKASGAVCEENENLFSTCRLCGNGRRENGEVCDDGSASHDGGCLNCLSVTPGWKCIGGSVDSEDSCTAGPDSPTAPVVGTRTETSIAWTWNAVDGHGLSLSRYRFEYHVSNTSGTFYFERQVLVGDQTGEGLNQQPQLVVDGLARDNSVIYKARVTACSLVGCSEASPFSALTFVKPPSATTQLVQSVNSALMDPDSLASATNLTVTEISVDAPTEECDAGETGETCLPCDTGFYKSEKGPAECRACAPNSNTIDPPRTICKCNAGYTGPDGSEYCTFCPAGKFKDAEGSAPCTDCDAGTHSTVDASTTSDSCSYCPTGQYAQQPGAAVCAPCEAGKFSASPGATVCSDCDRGKYLESTGGIASSNCQECQIGKYSTLLGARSESECQLCPRGKFGELEGRTAEVDCILCGPGTFSATTGASTCVLCAPGKYSLMQGSDDQAHCVQCSASKYATAAQGATGCTDCDYGKTATAGSFSEDACEVIPEDCPAGFTGPVGDCTECQAGTFKSITGSAPCNACPANAESVAGSSTCPCKAGFDGPDGGPCVCAAGTFLDGSSCVDCPSGKYAAADASECTDCVAGKYSSAPRATICTDCGAGKYLGSPGGDAAEDCVECPAGKYSSLTGAGDVNDCQDCSAGKYVSTTGNVAATECVLCVAGKYSGAGSTDADACQSCPAGQYAQQPGAAVCAPCEAGKFSASPGATVCSDCGGGTFSAPSAQRCTECAIGKFSGANSEQCMDCMAGKYSDVPGAIEANCLPCSEHAHSPAGSTDVTACKCEKHYTGPDGGQCVACDPGQINPSGGSAPCRSPSIPPQPQSDPVGGEFVGYVDVEVQITEGDLFYSADGSIPKCLPRDKQQTSASLTLSLTMGQPTSHTLQAISCSSEGASPVMMEQFNVVPGPMVVVAFKMEGEVTAADITGEAKEKLITSLAKSLGIPKERIFDVTVRDARRRLLAVEVELGIAAASEEEAELVENTVQSADLSSVAADAGLQKAQIGRVETNVRQIGEETPQSSQAGMWVGIVITLAAVVCGMAACYWVWHHPSIQPGKGTNQDLESNSSAEATVVLDPVAREKSIAQLAEDIEKECHREDAMLTPFSDTHGHAPLEVSGPAQWSQKMTRAIGWWKYRSGIRI
jgi:cysteine-rich repeat protein